MRPFAPGRQLAPGYEVIAHLARSNVLDVYDAWSHERACRCVVKLLRPDRRGDERAARALLGEGRLLQRLCHPHIVRGYETLFEPLPAVVMETLRGETVAHLVERRARRLGAAELGHLGVHLCSAISYLHGIGVLHLDLKPSNVIAEAGRAKIIDLSVARAPGPIEPGIGTWCYMAPEQARGGAVGPPADVWGIAAILYEAATGDAAFGDDDDEDVEYPSLARAAHPVARGRRLPDVLAAAIDAGLRADPAERPSVAQLGAACERAAGLPAAERRFAAQLGVGEDHERGPRRSTTAAALTDDPCRRERAPGSGRVLLGAELAAHVCDPARVLGHDVASRRG
ncbi:MAG TPA: serine/threonine-protein kinase [Solirubrobacteraceae bacterium]|nr:serine/threonine-protein kinase [Solirubrobacteraceae bacterium]